MWQQYSFLARQQASPVKPVVGISACLAGEQVRYDGQAKTQPELLAHLTPCLQLLPLCPEVAIGMGVPRNPIQLIQAHDRIEAVPLDDPDTNYTDALERYATQVTHHHSLPGAPLQGICGYIFKSRSPSCGLGSAPVFDEGSQLRFGDGIYAHQLCRELPWLPVLEEQDLDSPAMRDYFIFRASLIFDFHLAITAPSGVATFQRQHGQLVNCATNAEQQKLARLARKDAAAATEFLVVFGGILDGLNHRELLARVEEVIRSQ